MRLQATFSLAKIFHDIFPVLFLCFVNTEQKMLNFEQSKALSAAVSGHNVLICGQAGTGKSHTLKTIVNSLRKEKRVSLLCSTGMACLQVKEHDAKTVHRYDCRLFISLFDYFYYVQKKDIYYNLF